MNCRALCLLTVWCCVIAPGTATAALSDEIQVYTDDINAPGEYGLELHVNTTPSGRTTPDYPGEAVPNHGLRITPEFSYGITKTWEVLVPELNRFYVAVAGKAPTQAALLRYEVLPTTR